MPRARGRPQREPGSPAPLGHAPRRVSLLPGFQVERLFTVPKDKYGSWVSMTIDPKGRIIAGQRRRRRTVPPHAAPNRQQRADAASSRSTSTSARPWACLFAFDSLYVTRNGGGSGLYRLRDTNGDDQFDEVVKLKGPARRRRPRPARLAALARRQADLSDRRQSHAAADRRSRPIRRSAWEVSAPASATPRWPAGSKSRLSPNWDEDLLLPRQWDAGGHAVGILAPGGWIAATDPDGKHWEVLTVGFRNAYDMALNADGEMFAYDADMEWDMGMPWYRPTRILHAVSGADFGWRSGTGKWPAYRVDSLPAVVNMGPGSPVGVEFGYGAKFPAKYQRALFALDWSYRHDLRRPPHAGRRQLHRHQRRIPLPHSAAADRRGRRARRRPVLHHRRTRHAVRSLPRDLRRHRIDRPGRCPQHPVRRPACPAAKDRGAFRSRQENPHETATRSDRTALARRSPHPPRRPRLARADSARPCGKTACWPAADPDSVIGGVVALAHAVDSPAQPALLAALERLDFGKLSARQQLDLSARRGDWPSFVSARPSRSSRPAWRPARSVLSRHERVAIPMLPSAMP